MLGSPVNGSGLGRGWQAMAGHGMSGEATRDVRGVSGVRLEVTEVMVVGGGGSESEVS